LNSAKDLKIYQRAYALAMEVFDISRQWPLEEKFSLSNHIRRSSCSVCTNLREAWSKRRYEAYFVSKLTDCDGENSETDTWLDFARDCGYLLKEEHARLTGECEAIGGMLGSMLNNPAPFLIKKPVSSQNGTQTSDI